MSTMLHTDPVTFYSVISNYRTMEYAQSSTWVLLHPAELLFTHASSLAFSGDKELNPELCPKWNALSEILKTEIPAEMKKSDDVDCKIIILCQDTKTCFQLRQFLRHGPHFYLYLMALRHGLKMNRVNKDFDKWESLKEKFPQSEKPKADFNASKFCKKTKTDSKDSNESGSEDQALENLEDMKDSYLLTMSQTICEVVEDNDRTDKSNDYIFEPCPEMENMDLTQILNAANSKPTILIQTFQSSDRSLSLQKTLEDLQPNYIIMYHSNMTAIRQIELYEARRKKDHSLKTYFLIHAETVEEQSYLTTLRREKEAFEYLIQTKSTMVVPEDQDGKIDLCLNLQREVSDTVVNTRQGGKADDGQTRQFVIVDMREFRSELPALIHKRGIDIEPVTISVGDYILTPDICLERKSLSDLVGSLNTGRLYQQCTQMTRCYTNPMLLIEFDQNKPFCWQSNYMISNDGNSFDIQQKLLLLTLHFPKLKIVWSPSPYASAQLIEELKVGKDQPNIQYAIGSEDLDIVETKYNAGVYDFVQKLQGITSKNIDGFLRQTVNLKTVIKKSEDELKEILGNSSDARSFYSIIHEEHMPKEVVNVTTGKGKAKNKYKYTKK